MELKDYPMLYQASDFSSIQAQKKHFRLFKAKIALLLIIAVVASLAWNQVPSLRTPAAIILAIFLVVSMLISAFMDKRKFDWIWFSSRAIAESVKTESWKFMMKVDPYNGAIKGSEAENSFLDRLDELLHRQSSICSELTPYLQKGGLITKRMKQIRNDTLKNRCNYYTQNRIGNQRIWYTSKAKLNKQQESRWFIISWILQVVAATIAIVVISFSDLLISPVGILTTAGVGALSWTHARSYRELSQSYGLAAQELALLEERASQATTEKKLGKIVLDTERAISREHTIWLARRL